MREQLKLLEDLQRIDLQLQESEQALADLPSKLQSMKDDVQRIEAILGEEREQLQETQAYKSELEDAQAHDRDLLAKTKSKLASIRTSKEYMATQREFETNRKLTSDREDEIAKLDQAIKEKEAVISEKEQQLEELRSHVADEAKETENRLVEIESTAKGQRSVRQQKAEAIQKGLLRKYDRIRRVRQGTAVVPATDGVCTGCRMQLPPQLYNILQRQESIEQCPNCQRIVFYEAPPEDEAAEV
ncbi:MAG: hypothetical protein CSA65_02650 [Proteobacteria bacterium]|nr:MAG: hypothetical protein CSB49_04185 [Pseudomonadota bacterium]PIE19398.1 MAG: hypothetical protein CSA65_02650 [Pseudomonadota bacterium]